MPCSYVLMAHLSKQNPTASEHEQNKNYFTYNDIAHRHSTTLKLSEKTTKFLINREERKLDVPCLARICWPAAS